jgi:hydroxymethylbilane synthase
MKVRIGTRKSPLAVAQARLVAAMLGVEAEIIPMTTTGDQLTGPLTEEGGKGLFTKELEEALLAHTIDIAVHSAKDMQTTLPAGLVLACVPEREDVRDVLIGAASIAALPQGAVLGSASLRRSAQALRQRPDLKIINLRGNVQTRLDKIKKGEAHATLLALAGLKRLGISPLPGTPLSVDEMLPAVAQGALGIECRKDDTQTQTLLAQINHAPSMTAVICERALLRALDGSCRTPIAGLATLENKMLRLRGMLLSPDGKQCWQVDEKAAPQDAEKLGTAVGKQLAASS